MSLKYYQRAEFWYALALGPIFWILLWLWSGVTAVTWPSPLVFALSVIVYPLLEEIVFRGGLQGALSTRMTWHWHKISAANCVTSVIFSLAHVALRKDLMLLMVFFPSLVFGYFYDRDRSWVPAFILHAFYNLGYIILYYSDASK